MKFFEESPKRQSHQEKLQEYFRHQLTSTPPPRPPPRDRSLSPPKSRPQPTRGRSLTRQVRPQSPNVPKNEPKVTQKYEEVAISFEQVKPKTYRIVGGSTTVGPVPATNKVALRPLRRTFPQISKIEPKPDRKRTGTLPKLNLTRNFFSFGVSSQKVFTAADSAPIAQIARLVPFDSSRRAEKG